MDAPHDRRTDTPGRLLDDLRAHPEWPEARRDEYFERLVVGFPPTVLVEAVLGRFRDLSGADAEAILRLVESLATTELLEALAEALIDQPNLSAERDWAALDVLHGAGILGAYPALAERWEDLAEAIDDDEGSLEDLAAQIEDDPDGSWVALQGLEGVEPQVRAEIIAGLASGPMGPGLASFLRLLAFAHDPGTRSAALEGLAGREEDNPALQSTWASIAAEHPDPEVVALACRRLGRSGGSTLALKGEARPKLLDCLVTAMDGRGRAHVVLAAEHEGKPAAAAFLCDAVAGVLDVLGHEGAPAPFLAEFADQPGRDAVSGVPALALGLLAGSLLLNGPTIGGVLREWLGRTAGPDFRPRPFAGPLDAGDPEAIPMAEMTRRAAAVLDSCRGWVDESDLTYELAEEIELREGTAPADPGRDAGAYRFLFEHRLIGLLEPYRRMLLWMSAFWQAGGDEELSRSALALAAQLSDPQHAVPGHAFAVALTTRSLEAARANLRLGIDLRDPQIRAGGKK